MNMTKKEIRLELAKSFLRGFAFNDAENLNKLYEWVIGDDKEESDDDSKNTSAIEYLQTCELTGAVSYKAICEACEQYGIKTVKDLIEFGGLKLMEYPRVGQKAINMISNQLFEDFNVNGWHKR